MRTLGTLVPAGLLRAIGVLTLVVATAAGCASDDGATASDPGDTASATATASTGASSDASSGPVDPDTTGPGDVDADQVAIVSQTAAGGEVSPEATALADDAAVQSFGAAFATPDLANKIARVVARTDVPPGSTLYAAVVAIGCDVPTAVVVTSADAGFRIEAEPAGPSNVQCFASVTSVALVLVRDS